MMAPAMLGMAVGSMVGHLAKRVFGLYDLPIPRASRSEAARRPGDIDGFADDWALLVDEMRLWVLPTSLRARGCSTSRTSAEPLA